MPLQPILLEKLNDGIVSRPPLPLTRRDAALPGVPGKVHAVIGMRRAGKTCFLRQLQSERVEILVSGSSARMLSREVHTSLRGRGMETVIRPFSFREFLRHRGEEPDASVGRSTSAQRSLLEKRFREYLVEGGLPEAQGLAKALRIQLLQGYVDTVLFRDVVERYGISQVVALPAYVWLLT